MLATMSAAHLLLAAVVILLLFGAQKIPQLMRSMGSGLSEFKKGLKEGENVPPPPPLPVEAPANGSAAAPTETRPTSG